MKTNVPNPGLAATSILTAVLVVSVNTASALYAFHAFLPKRLVAVNEPLISDKTQNSANTSTAATTGTPSSGTPAASQRSEPKSDQVAVRKPSAKIVVGQPAQPASVTTDPSGQLVYHWCSGINPSLPDDVCEAILSIASQPTTSNPHLSDEAKMFLSLLPKDITLTMDETSWSQTSPSSGTMIINAHTAAYGDVKLKVTLEKTSGIWIVTDGQLA